MGGPNRDRFLLGMALQLAERGMYVFPLHPATKRPAIDRWETRATVDPNIIRTVWSARPYNVGIATGPSGLVVVDLDAPKEQAGSEGAVHGRQSLVEVARAAGTTVPRETFTVVTPGGQHLYFRAPDDVDLRNTAGRLARCVDSRANGGYVVGPGSVVPRGRYRLVNPAVPIPLPTWILDGLRPAPAMPVGAGAAPRRLSAYVRAAVRGEAERVESALVGGRNHALFRSSARLGSFVVAGSLTESEVRAVLAAACSVHVGVEGFSHDEVRRTIDSGLRQARPVPERPTAAPPAASR